MNAGAIRNRFPELLVVALLVALGPACGGGGSGQGLTLPPMVVPPVASTPIVSTSMLNRTSGVAPMSVFCTAAMAFVPGSSTTMVPQPADMNFSTFQYSWDFGDPGSGTWANTGLPKNSAIGFTAAHIYETPGTYTVTLTLTDAAGVTSVYPQQVVVSAFSGTTYYIAAAGNDANDGLSPGTAWQTVGKMIANAGTNRRFLFNRGDTFTTPGAHVINAAGPGFIGAYGSGAKPIIRVTGTAGGIKIRASDWAITDIEFIGPGVGDQVSAVSIEETKPISRTLLQRLTVHDFRVDIGWSDWPTIYTNPQEGNCVAECLAYNMEVNGFYLGGRKLAILGNIVQDCLTSHLVRVWQANHGVIAHNIFARPGNDRHALKLHGTEAGDGRPETQFVTVSDNTFTGTGWVTVIGSQDELHDQRVTQVIYERNVSTPTSITQAGVMVKAREITIRNNIFLGTGSEKFYSAVLVGTGAGLEPPAQNVRILNNSVFKGDAGSTFDICGLDTRCSLVTVRNNIASSPLISNALVVRGTCPGLIVDHNLNAATVGFVNPGSGNLRLAAGSPGIDAGAILLEVKSDYSLIPRPAGAADDLGAFEQ